MGYLMYSRPPGSNSIKFYLNLKNSTVIPNKGFESVSWNLNTNDGSAIPLRMEQENNYLLKSFLDFFSIKTPDSLTKLHITQFEIYPTVFQNLPSPILPKYLLGVYNLTATIFTG